MYTLFVFIIVVIAFFTLWTSLRPMSGKHRHTDISRNPFNLDIYKQRLQELEEQHQQKRLSDVLYQQIRNELEQALLKDVPEESQTPQSAVDVAPVSFKIPLISGVCLFLLAGTLYWKHGNWEAVDPENHKLPSPAVMITRLQKRLTDDPQNAENWFLLGQSYAALKRYADARDALRESYRYAPDNFQVLIRYIEAIGHASNGDLKEAEPLVQKALQMQPDLPDVQWFHSLLLAQTGELQTAVHIWEKLLSSIDDSGQRHMLEMMIANGKQRLGITETRNIPDTTIAGTLKVKVALDPALAANARDTDIVFIYARAASGPPMPLAVTRKHVRDLPVTITLGDHDAMMPNMTLSKFPEIVVGARISKSGSATPGRGDLQKISTAFLHAKQTTPVELVISEIIP